MRGIRGFLGVLGLGTFADSLHGADLGSVFHGMEGEVYLRDRSLLVDGAKSIINLSIVARSLIGAAHDGGCAWNGHDKLDMCDGGGIEGSGLMRSVAEV